MLKRKVVVFILMLISAPAIAASPVQQNSFAEAQITAQNAVDQEMIKMLRLRDEQIGGYLDVMQFQRKVYLATSVAAQQQRLAIYEETIEMLRPILDNAQLVQFAAYAGSVIIERSDHSQLSRK